MKASGPKQPGTLMNYEELIQLKGGRGKSDFFDGGGGEHFPHSLQAAVLFT